MHIVTNESMNLHRKRFFIPLFFVVMLLLGIPVASSSATPADFSSSSSHGASSSATFLKAVKVDLSYLHRTKSDLLAKAFRQALQSKTENIEIDISASWIEKNITDLLQTLNMEIEADRPQQRAFGIIAQRNQWTHTQATLLLETIVGPQEIIIEERNNDKMKKKRRRNSSMSTIPTTNETEGGVEEIDEKMQEVETNHNRYSVDGNLTHSETVTADTSASANATTRLVVSSNIVRLDLGWNNLGGSREVDKRTIKAWHQILQRTISDPDKCPTDLKLPVCGLGPAACRAIAKGLMARFERKADEGSDSKLPRPLSLQLVGNEEIGDPGVAALCAAIRTITSKQKGCTVLDVLDLSGCGISDAGAEALAIALEHNPFCVRKLDLSNNKITNQGASALGRALAEREKETSSKIETLDLSNNKGIDDAGAKALAAAFQEGTIDNLVLRSCHVHADGAAALIKAVKALALSQHRPVQSHLDLSGNPLGILRKKPRSGGSKYSATALRSKATATTAACMSLIGKTVQKGLKDWGISDVPDTLESDDEEENDMKDKEKDEDPSLIKCGALGMADALLMGKEDGKSIGKASLPTLETPFKLFLGLRHCAFDTRAAEALAAIKQELLSSPTNIDITIDVKMNNVLEEHVIAALRGDPAYEADLGEMAERYLEAMEALLASRKRSIEAARNARSRMQAEEEYDNSFGESTGMGDFAFPPDEDEDEEDPRDSDADYDDEKDMEDFF